MNLKQFEDQNVAIIVNYVSENNLIQEIGLKE